ncbi:MAG TPA: M56 family metallopeptidase, partial [Pirellulales bacterium]
MSALLDGLAAMLLDYYVAGSLLLTAVLGVMAILRQPVERMTVAWGAMLGLIALAVLCALPAWPRISLASRADATATQVATSAIEPTRSTAEFVPPAQDIRPLPGNARLNPAIPERTHLRENPASRIRRPTVEIAEQPALEAPAQPVDWKTFIVVGFLLGGLGTLLWQIFGGIQLWRLCQAATPAPDFAAAELRQIVGQRERAPRLLVSSRVRSAAACGMWRPTILLPALLVTQPPADAVEQAQLAALLSHEWAHVRRGDLWLLFLSRVLLAGLYLHPLFWWLLRRIGIDQELIADTLAAQTCGRKEFAAYLVAWARRQPSRSRPTAALGIWQRRAELSRRISMLLDERIRLGTTCSRAVRGVAGVSIAALVAMLSLMTLQPAPAADTAASEEPTLAVATATEPVVAGPAAIGPAAPQIADDSAPPTKVKINGVCLDDRQRPLAGARASIYRVDAGNDHISHPSGRLKFEQGFLPGMTSSTDGVMGQDTYSCDRNSQRLIEEVPSDEAGRFEFSPLTVDPEWLAQKSTLWICVQATGKATQWDRSMVNRRSDKSFALNALKFTLPEATTLRGRVTDKAGKPVAGATISVAMADHLPKPVPGVTCVTSNANGEYEIADLAPFDIDTMPPELASLGAFAYVSVAGRVEHPDYAPQLIEYTKLPAVADAVLSKPATLTIRVRAAEKDEPLAKAHVQWTDKNGISQRGATDERGECVAERLEPGSYTVEASTAARLRSVETLDLNEGPNAVELKSARGGILKGRLVDDATGKPPELSQSMASNVGALLAGADAKDSLSGWVDPKTGEFTMVVRPGRNQISFASLGAVYQPSWELVDAERWSKTGVEVPQGQTIEIELRIKPNKTMKSALQDGFDKWRNGLMAKAPLPEAQLREILAQGGVADLTTETIDGKEEITTIVMQRGHFGLEENTMELAPIERSLLAHIRSFTRLKALMLYHPPGGDAAFQTLRGIESLETFGVGDLMSDLGAAGVADLATLPNLTTLYLFSRKLDDAAIEQLAKMPKLENLMFGGALTDKGLEQLSGKTSLRALMLTGVEGAKFTDAGLAHLGRMKNLKQLGFASAVAPADEAPEGDPPNPWNITNDGLRHLAALADLEDLTLTGPQLTDAGLVHLRGLKKLKRLTEQGTQITPEGIETLRKFLPELKPADKPKPTGTEPAAQGASTWPASPKRVAVSATEQPLSLAAAQNAPPVKLVLRAVCLDDQKRPVAGAHARLFRVDAGTDLARQPATRHRFGQGVEPVVSMWSEGILDPIHYHCDRQSQRLIAEVRSDAAGQIEFSQLAADSAWEKGNSALWVCVQAPGRGTEWERAILDRGAGNSLRLDPLKFTLRAAATLRGRVTDSAGRPVAGALVVGNSQLPKSIPKIGCAVTDADGRYEIADLPPFDASKVPPLVFAGGTMESVSTVGWIEHADFATHLLEYTKLPDVVDAVLLPPAGFTARVVDDDDGKPMQNAHVQWTSPQGEICTGRTNEQGVFVATGLEPGECSAGVSVDGRLNCNKTVHITVDRGAVEFRLKRGGVIKGRLIDDATGKPAVLPRGANVNVFAFVAGGVLNDTTGGAVDRKTAEFTFSARQGRNQISLRDYDECWELIDAERWVKQGVDVAQGQTDEIELRVKANKAIGQAFQESLEAWRTSVMAKAPYSEETLREMLTKGRIAGAETETIAGKDEIIAIEVALSAPEEEQQQMREAAPIERSLLAHIQKFPQLRTLILFHPPGGDKVFESLRGLQHLERLEIADAMADVTSASVKPLATLPNLQSLFLASYKLDDGALAELAKLPKLRELRCGGVFTDAGLAQLSAAKSLTVLWVFSTGEAKITDAGLAHLGKLTKLTDLVIAELVSFSDERENTPLREHSAITNDGLRHLAGLTELETLTISGSHLTDAGLVHLHNLKKLKSLSTDGTKITPAGVEELRKFLPLLKAKENAAEKPKEAAPQPKVTTKVSNAPAAVAVAPADEASREGKIVYAAPASPPAAPTDALPPVILTIAGVCLDEHQKPLAGVRARLFRIDEGTDLISYATGRLKVSEGFLPELKTATGTILATSGVSCDRNSQRVLADVRADGAGRVEFAPLLLDEAWESQTSSLWVCAQAPGKATQWSRAIVGRRADKTPFVEPLKFTLPPATKLRGRVTDAAGRPVAGALVTAGNAHRLVKPVVGIECAETDADGRYEITDLAPYDASKLPPEIQAYGALEYVSAAGTIEHRDFASHVIEYAKLPAEVNAVLAKPATLVARVVADEDGTPLPKANIFLN